jgi:aminodeoxyfutalosine deaminase
MEETNVPPLPPHFSSQQPFILRARVVLPVSRPALDDGAVLVSGNRISAVGKWNDISAQPHAEVIDLGDVVLTPGLINAHCHLDYTNMAGLLPPQKLFTDWIKLMLATKAEWNYTEFAESWLHGAQMLLRTGTTTVGDYEAVPELLPDVWSSTPLRILSFMEMTGVKSRRSPQAILAEALSRTDHLHDSRSWASLAPHAPYSTAPDLIRISAEAARERQLPISIHVSESSLEFEMFCDARGEMYDWLRRNDRDLSDCGHGSPVKQLNTLDALGPNLLAVHVNYLGPSDATLLAERGVHVVHCPRSHSYFQHAPFPYQELADAGVNICLGTDSLATVYKTRRDTVELSLFDEIASFAAKQPNVSPETIVRMATVNGARALGLAEQAGELREDSLADLIAIPFSGAIDKVWDAVVSHRGNVLASMINGQWAMTPAQSQPA